MYTILYISSPDLFALIKSTFKKKKIIYKIKTYIIKNNIWYQDEENFWCFYHNFPFFSESSSCSMKRKWIGKILYFVHNKTRVGSRYYITATHSVCFTDIINNYIYIKLNSTIFSKKRQSEVYSNIITNKKAK
jgi:hypothetical protein